MQLRSAQEEVRVIYAARGDSDAAHPQVLLSHIQEVEAMFGSVRRNLETGAALPCPVERAVGLTLIAALAVANRFHIDVLEVSQEALHAESP